jgi:hypothetical protein
MSDDSVVPFQKPKPSNDSQAMLRNIAKCLICRCEWPATAPVGTTWLECPACHLLGGRFIGTVNLPGDHWHCMCGNDLFKIMRDRTYCPVCGKDHDFK